MRKKRNKRCLYAYSNYGKLDLDLILGSWFRYTSVELPFISWCRTILSPPHIYGTNEAWGIGRGGGGIPVSPEKKKISFISSSQSWKNCMILLTQAGSMEPGWELKTQLALSITWTVYVQSPSTPLCWYEGRAVNTESWGRIPQCSVLLSQGSVTHRFSHDYQRRHLPSSTSPEKE